MATAFTSNNLSFKFEDGEIPEFDWDNVTAAEAADILFHSWGSAILAV